MPAAIFRALTPTGTPGRVANPRCKEATCERTTREGKPYCSHHVELSPYVAHIIAELALRDDEADRLTKGKGIAARGHLVRETLLMLEQGSYTAAKLSRLMDISHEAAETLIKMMDKRGLAMMSKTDRGALIIRRNDEPPEKERLRR